MAYIMDMASGTTHKVEEPAYNRNATTETRDDTVPEAHAQLQLAMVEATAQHEHPALHPAALDALIKTLED